MKKGSGHILRLILNINGMLQRFLITKLLLKGSELITIYLLKPLPILEQVQIRRAIGLFLKYERIACTFNDEIQHFECLTN